MDIPSSEGEALREEKWCLDNVSDNVFGSVLRSLTVTDLAAVRASGRWWDKSVMAHRKELLSSVELDWLRFDFSTLERALWHGRHDFRAAILRPGAQLWDEQLAAAVSEMTCWLHPAESLRNRSVWPRPWYFFKKLLNPAPSKYHFLNRKRGFLNRRIALL